MAAAPDASIRPQVGTRKRLSSLRWFVVVAPLTQVLALLWLIWNRTPDVPWWDEWETVKLVHKFDQGTIGVADFWAFHNEHRIVIPRLINLTVIELTHWNRQIEMTVDLMMAVGAFFLILLTIQSSLRSAKAAFVLAIPVVLLILSLAQWEDFLWPFQSTFIATVFSVALCTWALGTRPAGVRGFGYALLAALIASLSSFGGLIVWVAFLPALWLAGYRRVQYFLIWFGVAAAVVIPYMYGFPRSSTSSPAIIDAFAYALAYLGAPAISLGNLGRTPHLLHVQIFAAISILVTLANVAVFWLLGRTLKPLCAWIGLGLFALGVAAVTALGRGPTLGTAQALTSRYQAFSALWWIAALVIACATYMHLMEKLRSTPVTKELWPFSALAAANLGILGVVSVALVIVNVAGFQDGRRWMDLQREHESCILQYETTWNSCLGVYYLPGAVSTLVPYLAQDHLGIFHNRTPLRPAMLTRRSGTTPSSIEVIGQVIVADPHSEPVNILQTTGGFTVTGWAIDAPANAAAGGVFILIDGQFAVATEYGFPRPEVATGYGNATYTKSGFGAAIDVERLSPGLHTISIAIVSQDRQSYYLSPQSFPIAFRASASAPSVATLSGLTKNPATTRVSFGAPDGGRTAQSSPVPIELPQGQSLDIDGWAVDTSAMAPASALYVSVDDARDIRVEYGSARPDVAQALESAAYLRSGFRATIPSDALPVGRHTVMLKVVTADGHAYYEPAERLIVDVR